MIISHKNKFVLYNIPKCASTSIHEALINICGEDDIYTCTENRYQNIHLIDNIDHHSTPHEIPPPKGYKTIGQIRNPWEVQVSFWHWQGIDTMTFEECIDYCKWDYNKFWDYQYDHLIRYENLEEDFNKMCSKLKLGKIELGHYKKKERKDYREYYNKETKNKIYNRYTNIIKQFNYKF